MSFTYEFDWQNMANDYVLLEKYDLAAKVYEKRLLDEPNIQSHYWNLGLLLLLQGKAPEAKK